MSFNIQQPFGTNWDNRKANAASVLNNESPDVIGTQEAVNYQRDYLIGETGYSWYGSGRDGGDSGEGSWIFYKTSKYTLDASNSGNFWMSDTPTVPSRFGGSYNRICTYVRLVDNSTGQGFYVFNAHFPTPDLYSERLASMKMMANRMSSRSVSTDPVYLTGDFNSNEGDGVTIWMKSGSDNPLTCRDTYRDVDLTGNVTTGFGTKFDYIYCPNSIKYTTNSSYVVTSPSGYSDHMAIVADVSYSDVVVIPDPIVVPGKVEAEDYRSKSGGQLEDTDDIGGGENVGFLEVDDWLKYSIDVIKAADYQLEIRSAGETNTGEIDIYVDDVFEKTVTMQRTGNWQVWGTTIQSLDLESGLHELKLVIKQDGFNLNWLRFSESISNGSFQVKIVSANLWRKSNDWTTRKANVVDLINGELPDVVGIQEGDEGKQAELDTDLSNYTLETGPWNDQSTAILYHSGKISLVETGVFGFSSQPDNPNFSDWGDGAANGWLRVCNWALFEQISTGARFYVYNTHLDANGFTSNAGEWRSQEVRLMTERISNRTYTDYPFVLVGDLNGVEQEEAIVYLKSSVDNPVKMIDTYREILPNGPGDSFGSVKYDYIMIEDKSSNQVVDANIIYHSEYGWTSDHNQVFATINFFDQQISTPQISLVSHLPEQPVAQESIDVSATVVDLVGLANVTLIWGTQEGVLTSSEVMTAIGNGYNATIQGQPDKATVYYQIEAENEEGEIVLSETYLVFVSDDPYGLYADYDMIDLSFTGFGGSSFNEIENPFRSAKNNSERVGSTVQGLETWAGIYSQTLESIDFTITPIFKMNVYGPKLGNVLVKFEDEGDSEVFYDLSIELTEVNQWTEISINFNDAPSGVYEKLVLFFDYDNGVEDVYYFDDIRLESIVTGVNSEVSNNIVFTPNPASDQVTFSEKCRWSIYTATGELISEGHGHKADVTNIHKGVYFIGINGVMERLMVY